MKDHNITLGMEIGEFNPILLATYNYKVVYVSGNYIRLSSGRHYRLTAGVWIQQDPMNLDKMFTIKIS